MFEFPPFSIWSLWIILVPLFAFIWIVMEAGNRRRGVRIENKEDHVNAKVSTISMMPILAWLVMSIFTPIVVGPLFWVGCALIIIAGIIYVSAIEAFVRAGSGLTTIGIYRISRNPMYVALFVLLLAFVLMSWQAAPIMGLLTLVILLWDIIITHWMVLGEERFLSEKYGDAYREYINKTPRYFLFF